jgi:hypothetical protein
MFDKWEKFCLSAVDDIGLKFLALSSTEIKSAKWQFSSLNRKLFFDF